MILASAYYPYSAGARFDFDYYRQQHLTMVHRLLSPYGLLRSEVVRGLPSPDGNSPRYLAVGLLHFADPQRLADGLAAHGAEILADVSNYTDLSPDIQFAEVLP
ncbi:EthD family reductase [Jeongeupia sp. HS-3]|uniref:EthD family reductase n=1 Tax=Jeongeupia sp. HS-3 TaxID=1009682 RepID=UPI0019110AE1|nr:EthD family reductase [Jeongeupia sp. HS-3]